MFITVCTNMPKFIQTKGSKISKDAPSAKAFAFFHSALVSGADLTGKIEVRHEGKCGACGRKLTVPESIDSGFGPICGGVQPTDGSGIAFNPEAFIHAGNATFTITSVATGVRFTYKVRAKKDDPTAPLFVSILNGPDNWTNYKYLGIIVGVEPKTDAMDHDHQRELELGISDTQVGDS